MSLVGDCGARGHRPRATWALRAPRPARPPRDLGPGLLRGSAISYTASTNTGLYTVAGPPTSASVPFIGRTACRSSPLPAHTLWIRLSTSSLVNLPVYHLPATKTKAPKIPIPLVQSKKGFDSVQFTHWLNFLLTQPSAKPAHWKNRFSWLVKDWCILGIVVLILGSHRKRLVGRTLEAEDLGL